MTPTDPNPAREADGRADREAQLAGLLADLGWWSPDEGARDIIANRDAVLRAMGMREERGVRAVNRPIIVNSGDSDDPDVLAAKYDGQVIRRFLSDWEDVTDE